MRLTGGIVMGMFILIAWLILGAYFMVQNSDMIAEVTDEKMKMLGIALIVFSAPFYMIVEMFDYMLGQVFGEGWDNDGDNNNCCR
jgi:hypothetical protein